MKKGFFKSFTALVMAAAMMLGTATFVMADSGDLVAGTKIKGVTATSGTAVVVGDFAMDQNANTAEVVSKAGSVTLTATEAEGSNENSATATEGGEVVTQFYAEDETDLKDFVSHLTMASPTSAWEFTNEPVEDGSFMVLGAGTSGGTPVNIHAFKIKVTPRGNQPTSGVSTSSVTSEGKVTKYVFNAIVPTDLDFGINPFIIGEEGDSQITSDDYVILNRTKDVPFQVDLSFKVATPTAGKIATQVEDPDTLNKTNPQGDKRKLFYLAAHSPEAFAGTITGTTYADVDPKATYTEAGIANFKANGAATLSFVLDSVSDPVASVNEAANVAVFKYYGELNSYAPWADDDIKVKVNFTFIPMSATNYAAVSASATQANQINPGTGGSNNSTPGFTNAGATGNGTSTNSGMYILDKSDVAAGNGTFSVPFNGGGNVTSAKIGASSVLTSPTDYNLTSSAFIITAARIANLTVGAKVITFVIGGTTYTLNFTVQA
jgi:hypothetical protein